MSCLTATDRFASLTLSDIFGVPFLRVTAMENWGLILCRQQNIVYAEGIQAKRDKQFVTDVLSHEIAHMVSTPAEGIVIPFIHSFPSPSGSAIW
jgi:hypothetical protein